MGGIAMKTIEERARDLYNMLPIIQEYYIDTIARALRNAMRHQKSIDTRKACDWFKQTQSYWLDDKGDQPEPIEITEDILRQNKWKVQGYTLRPSEHYYVKDEGGNHLLLSHGTLSLWLACGEANDGVFSDVIVPCKYVHQFQQLLRLVGLSEIVDNFKV